MLETFLGASAGIVLLGAWGIYDYITYKRKGQRERAPTSSSHM